MQSCAKRFVLIGNAEKYSDILGATYPTCAVEVVPFACAPVKRWIAEKVGKIEFTTCLCLLLLSYVFEVLNFVSTNRLNLSLKSSQAEASEIALDK